MNKPIILGLILFLVVFAAIFLIVQRRSGQEQAAPGAITIEKDAEGPSTRRINVKLFFNSGGSTVLVPEDRAILYEENLHAQIQELLKELIKGPKGALAATIPSGTQLRDLFISKDGIAYADFSSEISSNHIGGSAAEMDTVYSIVNTIALNFPQIKGVQILVEDQAVETLNGHLDLSRPLKPDKSLIQPIAKSSKKS